MDIDTGRSYSSEANLIKGLVKFGFDKVRYLVVCNRQGRFTAIFPASSCDGDMTRFARQGFLTIG